jgi:hypothetical protein
MRKITKRSAAIITASIVGVGALGGIAMASGWLVEGKGIAKADTAEVKDMSAEASLVGKAYPGLATTANALIDNDNEFPVIINKAAIALKDGKPHIEAKGKGGSNTACLAALAAVGEAPFSIDPSVKNLTVEAGAKKAEFNGIKVKVSEKLPQECANTSFTVHFTFSGTSTVA